MPLTKSVSNLQAGAIGMDYELSAYPKEAVESHVLLLRSALDEACETLARESATDICATLIAPTDLISFSLGLGGHMPPVQVSPGRLSGLVLRIDLGHIEIMYETCNQDLIFEDDHRLVGACLYREEQGLRAHFPSERGLIARPANSEALYVLCKTVHTEPKQVTPLADMSVVSSSCKSGLWQAVDQAVQILSRDRSSCGGDDQLSVPPSMVIPIIEGFRISIAMYEASNIDRRDAVLRQFYTLAKRNAYANVEELAQCLAMTRRNLHYYASSRLGIAPKKLIKSMALRNVMCQLPSTDTRSSSIADIAFEHGFDNPAQFSMDYRRHYGERPSETRRRYQEQLWTSSCGR